MLILNYLEYIWNLNRPTIKIKYHWSLISVIIDYYLFFKQLEFKAWAPGRGNKKRQMTEHIKTSHSCVAYFLVSVRRYHDTTMRFIFLFLISGYKYIMMSFGWDINICMTSFCYHSLLQLLQIQSSVSWSSLSYQFVVKKTAKDNAMCIVASSRRKRRLTNQSNKCVNHFHSLGFWCQQKAHGTGFFLIKLWLQIANFKLTIVLPCNS